MSRVRKEERGGGDNDDGGEKKKKEKTERDKKQILRWERLKGNISSWDGEKRSRVALKQKAKSHGVIIPSICDRCGKTFRTDTALSKHTSDVHPPRLPLLPRSVEEVKEVQPVFPTIDKIAEMTLQNFAQQILAKDYILLEHQRNELQSQMQSISKQKQDLEKEILSSKAKLKIELEQMVRESKLQIAESEKKIKKQENDLKKKIDQFNEEKNKMAKFNIQQKGRVKLDIGGHTFSTSVSTLTKFPNTFFSSMFSGNFDIVKEEDGSIFIDRSPKHFEIILNYLRDEEINLDYDEGTLNEILREVKFFSNKTFGRSCNKTTGGIRGRLRVVK